MDTSGMAIFDLAERRLAWIDQRQGLLAQNIANADTPGYASKDLRPFASLLSQAAPALAVTDPRHLASSPTLRATDQRVRPAQRAPDGNAVSMEDQLTKVADTDSAHALVLNIYHSFLGLFRTAAGK